MKIDNNVAKKLKKDFPIFKYNSGLVYLDNAATSQKPKEVIRVMNDFYEKENSNISRGLYTLAEKATQKYEESRKIIAEFIGAKTEEIVFTKNTTESMNLLSYSLWSLIKTGRNEILLTEMEHHSNLVPWQQLAKRKGFKLRFVRTKSDFTLDLEDLKKKISDKTAVFAFSYVSNILGTVNDVKLLSKIGKAKGAIVVVDGAQAVQSLPINVKDIGCDFFAFSSHKMLGPFGVGVLYGRKELLEKLHPFGFGGGMISSVRLSGSQWLEPPQRFEAGTQNVAGVIGLTEAVKYLQKIGMENIENWEKELLRYTLGKLKKVEGIHIYNNEKNSVGIISFSVEGIHPHDVAEILNNKKVAIRAGHGCTMPLMKVLNAKGGVCRASFYIYNTFEDADALVSALKKVKERFK